MSSDITTPVEYADATHQPTSARWRTALAVAYALLVVLPGVLIVMIGHLPPVAIVGAFVAYAFAFLPAYYLDHWLLAGRGFHSPSMFGLLTLCIAALLWPMPLVTMMPRAWRSPVWRRVIVAYMAGFIVFAVVAGWWMICNLALFFG
jgi:hypothetical protein